MKVADSVMAGKASDSSIKWQLCYDMSARTWWMVSWHNNKVFFPLLSFSKDFFLTPPSLPKGTCYEVHSRAKTLKWQFSDSVAR